ncbi:MAG: hypothetical protein CR988_08345 [Treponema sp.]|nr:MAG: hypothetical protein CR988_08345 [Treponema sp.]
MKTKKLILLLLTIAVIFLIWACGTFSCIGAKIDKDLPDTKFLKMSKNLFYRQTYNNCAPYSVMAVINILKGESPNPEVLAKQTPYRTKSNLTYPIGVVKQLSSNGIKAREYFLWGFNNKKKLQWLKTQINSGRPVILLIAIKGRTSDVRHYVTVLGYDKNGFMLYDSYQAKSKENPRKTIDDNKNLAGNRYYKNNELLKKWSKGGYGVFYNYWAVSAKLK